VNAEAFEYTAANASGRKRKKMEQRVAYSNIPIRFVDEKTHEIELELAPRVYRCIPASFLVLIPLWMVSR